MITGQDLQVVDGKPRVQDLKVAERLEFSQPYDIRKLIERNKERLIRRGELFATVAKNDDPLGRGRPATEYWLTKWQAIKICMWSEAPKADAVQDEIADVFDAYTDGKLVPSGRNQTPVTTDVLGQIFDFAKRTYEVVKGTHGKVVQLTDTTARIEQRVNDVIPRKEPSEKNKRIYIYTLAKSKLYHGCCPCGCGQQLLDNTGDVLRDRAGISVLEYDHWQSRERNGLEFMWPVHRDCNIQLDDDDYRQSKLARFKVFHEELKIVEHEVPDKPRKTIDDSIGQFKLKLD